MAVRLNPLAITLGLFAFAAFFAWKGDTHHAVILVCLAVPNAGQFLAPTNDKADEAFAAFGNLVADLRAKLEREETAAAAAPPPGSAPLDVHPPPPMEIAPPPPTPREGKGRGSS